MEDKLKKYEAPSVFIEQSANVICDSSEFDWGEWMSLDMVIVDERSYNI